MSDKDYYLNLVNLAEIHLKDKIMSDKDYYLNCIKDLSRATLADASVNDNDDAVLKSLDSLIFFSENYRRIILSKLRHNR